MVRNAPLTKLRGLFFLSLLSLFLLPQGASVEAQRFQTPIDSAMDAFKKGRQELVNVDFYKDVGHDDMLESYLTLSDVWSYLYRFRAEGEKLLKDTWLAFKHDKDFEAWKAYWPKSASLCVAWQENETWTYAALAATAEIQEATGEVQINWYFNEWRDLQYNIYTLREFLLDKFMSAAARASISAAHYQQLLSVLRTGAKDGQFEIHMQWFGGHLEIPIALIIVVLAAFMKRKKKW